MPEFEAALEELRRRSQPAPDVPADTTQQFVPNQTELDTEQDLELLRNQTSEHPDVQVETPRPAPKPLSSQELATDSLQNNLRHAAGVNPQEVAQRRKLANDLGVPKELLPDGPEAQEQLFLKKNDAAELMRSNPEIAAYLQDLDNAEVAGQDIGTLKKVSSLMRRFHLDPLVAAAKTTVAVPQTLAGIYKIYDRAVMSLIPDSVMKAVDDATPQAIREGLGNVEDQLAQAGIRLDFKQTQEFIDKFYSPETREAKEAVAKAEGFFGTIGTAVENPSAIATAIGESIGPMLLGGATAQVITKAFPAISPLVAGAAGEGVTIAGGTAQQITEETGGALTGQQALISAGTGVLGAGIGILGAKIAQKLGVGDLDTALARGSIEGAMVKSQVPAGLAKRILVGGGIEGMEELGQSGIEQIAQNIATEKPWNEGVPEAMAMGLLTGGVMGGTVQAFTPRAPEEGLNRDIDDAAVEALRNVAHAQQAEENKQTLEEFSKSVAESSLRANSPEEFKKFIRTMADEGEMISEVYVDAAKLDEAFAQSGITPEELQEKMPEVAKELALAKEVGSEVRISFDDYATHIAGSKVEVPLLDHLRTTPEGMTFAESQQFFQGQEKQLTEQAKEILETHQPVLSEKEFKAQEPEGSYQKYLKDHKNKAEVFAVDTKNVHQNILDGLNATGRFTKDINAVYAVPFREFYATAAAKEGILPSELYERMPLNFKNVRIEDGILDQPKIRAKPGDMYKDILAQTETDYRSEHTAPNNEDGARLDDLAGGIYPDDIYSNQAVRFYGTGDTTRDSKSIKIMQTAKGKPNKKVTMYRAVPHGVTEINVGDWVTINREYAVQHGESALNGQYVILEEKVPARSLYTNGDSIHEWGYWPEESIKGEQNAAFAQTEFTGRPGGSTTISGIPPLNGFEEQTKIRGRDGQPLTVFRGSDAGLQIDHFKKEALGFASGAAPSGRGVHFTTRKSSAAVHGDVREFQLDIRNPFVFKADDPKIPSHDTAEEYFEWREGLRAKGFDGIVEIASHLGGPNNIIAFDPEQVILKQGVFHQFAGARSDTADVFQLNRAIDLEAQGLDNDSIRLETGWFRGIDRKWRYEIDDSKATLKPIAEGKDTWLEIFDSTPDNITLGSLVDHPGLYAAYPALQDVVVGRTTGTGAQLIPSTERTPAKIEIGDQVPIGKVLSALMHEVQHALQEIEGFAFGTNTEHVKATAAAKIREASEAAKPVMRKIDKEVFAITERFIGGETEAVTQVEDAREKHKEVLGEGKSPSAYLRLEMMTREPTTANYLRVLEENQEAQNDPFNVYMRSAGEIEARNVETRLTLNEEGRRGFPPENTQDIPSSEAIVQFKGGVSSSLPPPANMFPQQPEQQIRAAYDPTNFTISLLKGADLSSVIHEGGHFYLEALADMAGQPNAVQQVKDDFRTTLNWFGINGDNPEGVWNMMTLEQKRQYHEQWAQSFERYNLEGKAPTTEMQPVFARFRAWMLQVYKSMKEFLKQNPLAGRLNDDIRQVFDRMLAADDAIKETEKAREYAPLFPNAEAAGVTPEEFQKYMEAGQKATSIAVDELTSRSLRDMKWLSNAKDRAIKSLQKEADAQRKIIREQVESEVMAEPINLARRLIRKGELVNQDGTVTKVTEHKLNTEDVKDLRPGMPLVGSPLSGMTKPGGLNPDLAAQFFGFDSGDALLEALLTEETAKEKIDGITDQRMLQEHGDLVDPTEIKRAAEKAIHNEARARFMATGLEMLAKQVGAGQGKGAVTQIAKAAKVAAENAISQKKVRELSPGQFEKAEAKANKEAIKQAAKDPKKAMEAQRAALLNNRLARAASEAKDEVDSALRYLKKFDSPNVRKQLTPDHLEQIDDLRANVDTRKGITNKQLDKRKSLQDWIDEQEANGFEPAIDPAVMDDLKRKHYKEMTVEELRGLVDSIKQIEHIARRLQKVFTARDKRKFQELVDDAWQSIEDNANRTVPERGTPTDVVGVSAKWARRMAAEHRKFNSIIREMDGGKDNGKMWNLLSRGMNEAGDIETEMKQVATDKISELFSKLPREKVVPGNIYSKKKMIPGTNLSMTQEQRIMFGMNWGNAGNRQRLLDGGMTGQRAISSKEADKVLDTLTKEEWDFIQGVWDYIATYKPQVAALEKKLTGVEPEWVEATPIKTKFGTYRGGYFPAKYDTELSTRSESLEAATDLRMGMKGAYGSAATRSGYTKARADEVKNRPLLLSYNVISQHVSEVTHRLAWQPWLIDANRLLKALDAPIRKHYGQEILKELRDTTVDIAQGDAPAKNATEQAINRLRTGSTIVGLGWRVSTAILQITGLTQSMARIGSRWAAVGVGKYVKSPIDSAKFADEKSRLMRDRSKTMNREINEILNTIRAGEKVSAFTATYFTMIGKMQRIVDLPTWHGAYEKALHQLKYENALDEKARKEIEDHAVALADQAVIDSQSGGHIKDLAKIQRGSPAWKLFTNFYSYFSAAYNLNIEAVRRTNFKSPSEVGLFAVDMLLINTIPTVMATALALAMKGGCDWEDIECIGKKLAQDQLGHFMGQMILLREMGAAISVATGGDGYGYQGPAGLRFFSDLYKAGIQINQGEADMPLFKAVNSTAGAILHYPAGQINSTVDGIRAIERGEVEGIQILPALISGPPKD